MVEPIRVLLVDDHPVVRQGLRSFLDVQGGITVVGEADDGRSCLVEAGRLDPDVILLDLRMPGADGLAALQGLRAASDPARVLVLTSFTDPAAVLSAIRAGAAGCVYKDVDPPALAAAIRAVHAGHVLLPADVAQLLAGQAEARGDPVAAAQLTHRGSVGTAPLTPREVQVLAEIARGRSNREIARALCVSEKTVKTHVSAVLAKLGLHDRTQAALHAVRHGLLSEPTT